MTASTTRRLETIQRVYVANTPLMPSPFACLSQYRTFGIEGFFYFTEEERASVQPPSAPYTREDVELTRREHISHLKVLISGHKCECAIDPYSYGIAYSSDVQSVLPTEEYFISS